MGLTGNQLTSLDWYISTINHRLTLLDPRYVHIGFGVVNDSVKVDVIDFGTPDWNTTADPIWEQWPPDGASGIGTSFYGESPNAFTAPASRSATRSRSNTTVGAVSPSRVRRSLRTAQRFPRLRHRHGLDHAQYGHDRHERRRCNRVRAIKLPLPAPRMGNHSRAPGVSARRAREARLMSCPERPLAPNHLPDDDRCASRHDQHAASSPTATATTHRDADRHADADSHPATVRHPPRPQRISKACNAALVAPLAAGLPRRAAPPPRQLPSAQWRQCGNRRDRHGVEQRRWRGRARVRSSARGCMARMS